MKKNIIFLVIILISKLSFSQIDEIPIDNSEEQGTFNKQAVTTSLKNAYPLAPWLNDFDKYIVNAESNRKINDISSGYYHVNLKSFCLRPGFPVGGKGYGNVIGPMKGTKAKSIKEIIRRWQSHPEIDQKYVQTLIWGLIAGLGYDDYPKDFRTKIDPLLPDEEKKSKGIKLKDLFGLVPDELKSQLPLYDDIKNLVKTGIGSYQDLERIAVPQGDPVGSSKDITIDPGGWTLFENGYYFRATPIGYDNITCDIYKPAKTEISYDSKGRVISIQSETGKIDAEYDDSPGADIISLASGNYKINRIKSISFNGTIIPESNDVLWTMPYDNSSSEGSAYKRLIETRESLFEDRTRTMKDFIESVQNYNKKKKVTTKDADIITLYDLKQFELAVKMLMDPAIIVLPAEDGEQLARIVTDASCNKISEVVYLNKISSGGNSEGGFNPAGLVVVPGSDGAQRIGISGEGPDEETPRVYLHNVNCETLPEPGGMYTATLEIVNNSRPIQEIMIDLYDISTEKGRYLNDKEQRDDTGPDMVFDPELNPGYRIEENSGSPPWFTAIGDGSSPLQIIIKSRDYGGIAKIKASVKINGTVYNAVADAFGTYNNIPCDNNNNHIADKWENDNGVYGRPADWDEEDNPPGQKTTGDGITLYEEYRGFFALLPDGTPQHVRLDPNKKEIFAIDDDFLLSSYTWEQATGIPVYRVNEAYVYGTLCGGDMAVRPRYRLLDFNSGYAAGVKYAVNVVKINGVDDPYNLCGTDTTYDGCSAIGPPINANVTIILPERSRRFLESIRNTLQRVYDGDPTSSSYYVEGEFIDHETMLEYLYALTNPAAFSLLLEFYVKTCAVHEVGHACGMDHHRPETGGDQDCPMRYYEYFDPLRLFATYYRNVMPLIRDGSFTPMVALGTLHFCTTGDNCWSKINVNDRMP